MSSDNFTVHNVVCHVKLGFIAKKKPDILFLFPSSSHAIDPLPSSSHALECLGFPPRHPRPPLQTSSFPMTTSVIHFVGDGSGPHFPPNFSICQDQEWRVPRFWGPHPYFLGPAHPYSPPKPHPPTRCPHFCVPPPQLAPFSPLSLVFSMFSTPFSYFSCIFPCVSPIFFITTLQQGFFCSLGQGSCLGIGKRGGLPLIQFVFFIFC